MAVGFASGSMDERMAIDQCAEVFAVAAADDGCDRVPPIEARTDHLHVSAIDSAVGEGKLT